MARALITATGAATDTAIVAAPGAGQRIVLDAIQFTVSAAATVSVSNGADGATTRLFYGDFAANGGIVAGDTGTSVIFTDSAPSGRTSSTRSSTRLPEDEPETVSVVAQLKSTPRNAVPFVGPVNRNCTEADPE